MHHVAKIYAWIRKFEFVAKTQFLYVNYERIYMIKSSYKASHIISDYLYAYKTKIRTLYLKNLVFSARNILK